MEDLPSGYRPNVGICLINVDSQIFVASRLNVPGAWQMPQGGIEDGEDPLTAAVRELREETGIVSVDIISEVPNWLSYDFPPAVKAKVSRLWGGGPWHGQAQKWATVCNGVMSHNSVESFGPKLVMDFNKLNGDDSEVNLASGEADAEFSEWKWESPEDVIEQAVDYKRPVYKEVMKHFKPYFSENIKSTKCKSSRW